MRSLLNQGEYHYDETSYKKVISELNNTMANNEECHDTAGLCGQAIFERVTGTKIDAKHLNQVSLPLVKVFMKNQVRNL